MTIPVLICDDSSFARKQMARALPDNWDVSLTFAKNGIEAMEVLRQGNAEVLFLDLNMPEMDGYEVLEQVRREDINSMVIVVSGDVQAEARSRVKKLGAMDFIKKPVNQEEIHSILSEYGILQLTENRVDKLEPDFDVDHFDFFKELANVSMGRGIDLLSRLLDIFIPMPIPHVSYLEIDDLTMTLKDVSERSDLTPICQGFIGAGIAGEVLLLFNQPDAEGLSTLMQYDGELSETARLEMIMDIATVLSGACLNGLTEQLDIAFSLGHPRVLGQHVNIDDLIDNKETRTWTRTLAIEMGFEVEDHHLQCNLLLLFTEDSLDKLNQLVSYIS
jgi:CheY-like chemotaxis protein